MSRFSRLWILLLMVALALTAGCARSPETKKARYLARGEGYFQKEQYREAIIEYRNAIRIEPTNARAIRQLGMAHYSLGEYGRAFTYLLNASRIEPDDLDVRIKLAAIYLAARKLPEARQEASVVLEKDPKNLDALILLAGSASTPQEVEAGIQALEAGRASFGDRAKFHLALGSLHLARKDLASAERAFQEAVAREPKGIESHSALGDFYLVKHDAAQAERELKTAAEIAPVGSRARLRLADFYLFA